MLRLQSCPYIFSTLKQAVAFCGLPKTEVQNRRPVPRPDVTFVLPTVLLSSIKFLVPNPGARFLSANGRISILKKLAHLPKPDIRMVVAVSRSSSRAIGSRPFGPCKEHPAWPSCQCSV